MKFLFTVTEAQKEIPIFGSLTVEVESNDLNNFPLLRRIRKFESQKGTIVLPAAVIESDSDDEITIGNRAVPPTIWLTKTLVNVLIGGLSTMRFKLVRVSQESGSSSFALSIQRIS